MSAPAKYQAEAASKASAGHASIAPPLRQRSLCSETFAIFTQVSTIAINTLSSNTQARTTPAMPFSRTMSPTVVTRPNTVIWLATEAPKPGNRRRFPINESPKRWPSKDEICELIKEDKQYRSNTLVLRMCYATCFTRRCK